ncbi:MAG: ATP-binding protein [Robiginitomaculum sp.]|nr:ATP-binding protein [Robiginitomaculum sp.]
MLLEFTVGNFRSFAEEQTFSMLPLKGASNVHQTGGAYYPEVMKIAALYGANGSGKSNLVNAIAEFREVVWSSGEWNSTRNLPYQPFIYDAELRQKPTKFEILLSIGDQVWRYGFSYNSKRIESEWLFCRPFSTNRENRVFERYFRAGKYIIMTSEALNPQKALLTKHTNDNQLFISKLDQFNEKETKDAFHWIVFGLRPIGNPDGFPRAMTADYCANLATRKAVVKFLNSVGIRVTDIFIETEETKFEGKDTIARILLNAGSEPILAHGEDDKITRYSIQFVNMDRNNKPIAIDFKEESSGTKNLFALAAAIMDSCSHGYTLIVDELNQSFHNAALRQIIKIFKNPEANPSGAQLIFTSHDTHLMNTLERDELWFADKQDDGATELFGLSDFAQIKKGGARREGAFGKQYLEGRYGALPETDILEAIRSLKTIEQANQ